jgi:predicted transcriptional regulator
MFLTEIRPISRYTTKNRGNLITIEDSPEVQLLIDQMTNMLLHEKSSQKEILELFCQTCKIIREKGLMCKPCQKKTPAPSKETCVFCRSI